METFPLSIKPICFSGETLPDPLSRSQAADLIENHPHPIWLMVTGSDTETHDFLIQELKFHELAVEDALSNHERPSVTEYDDYLFLVAPALAPDHPDGYVEVAFFLGPDYLVTVSPAGCSMLSQVATRWGSRTFPRHSPGDLLHMILDRIVDDYIPLMETIEDDVDTISDSIMSGGSGHIHELMALKRRLQQLRRRMAPLREVINSLLRRDVAMIKDETRPYFQDVYDHAVRVLESVDLQRDTLTSLVDVHLSVVSNKLNEVMKKMTVISTVLMTAALVAGIYGMNFESIPELHWRYGYAYSFGLMFLLSGLILVAFKRQNWI